MENSNFCVECHSFADGTWQFWLGTPRDAAKTAGMLIVYEPAVGRIQSIEIGPADRVGNSTEFPYWRIYYEYFDDASYVPSRVFYLPQGGGVGAALWEFEGIELNPDFSEETFSIEIPPGTEITDHISKQIYTIGSGVKDDDEAVAAFIARMDLKKTQPPLPPSGAPYSWRTKLLIANLAVAILAVAAAVGIRFRKKPFNSKGAGSNVTAHTGSCRDS